MDAKHKTDAARALAARYLPFKELRKGVFYLYFIFIFWFCFTALVSGVLMVCVAYFMFPFSRHSTPEPGRNAVAGSECVF